MGAPLLLPSSSSSLPAPACSSFGFLSASSRHYRKTVQTKEEECDGAGSSSVNLPFYVVTGKTRGEKGVQQCARTFARARVVSARAQTQDFRANELGTRLNVFRILHCRLTLSLSLSLTHILPLFVSLFIKLSFLLLPSLFLTVLQYSLLFLSIFLFRLHIFSHLISYLLFFYSHTLSLVIVIVCFQ